MKTTVPPSGLTELTTSLWIWPSTVEYTRLSHPFGTSTVNAEFTGSTTDTSSVVGPLAGSGSSGMTSPRPSSGSSSIVVEVMLAATVVVTAGSSPSAASSDP